MTTPNARYRYHVAYPHPSVSPLYRIELLAAGEEFSMKEIVDELRSVYPDHANDLKGAVLAAAPQNGVTGYADYRRPAA